jgi:hypothetical protein
MKTAGYLLSNHLRPCINIDQYFGTLPHETLSLYVGRVTGDETTFRELSPTTFISAGCHLHVFLGLYITSQVN